MISKEEAANLRVAVNAWKDAANGRESVAIGLHRAINREVSAPEEVEPRARYAACFRGKGWLVDGGVGGTFSFDVTQCCEWPSPERAFDELRASDLVEPMYRVRFPPLDGQDAQDQLANFGIYVVRIK